MYLAGPGDRRLVADLLDRAPGWTAVVAFGTDAYYTSPCQRVRIANPVESHYGGWTIAYAEDPLGVPDWITTFDRHTPAEVTAAFVTALIHGLDSHFTNLPHDGRHDTARSPAALLAQHGWHALPGIRPHHALSPDGYAAYQIRSGRIHEYAELLEPEKSTWRISAGPDPVNAPAWQAYFSSHTPAPLITASAATLTDPAPVPRTFGTIPDRHHSLVDIQLPSPRPPASHLATAAADRLAGQETAALPPPAPSTVPARPATPRRQR
ncbi:DUF317 domain-containing protein [Streptomyces sp. NPDC056244]|uniref:DUF317 domain-containing protein n=1 Tax=Streptomyces sp. NPDC056244 TaxID=3345762 RepID=UPI0035DFB995